MKHLLPILLISLLLASARAEDFDHCFIPGETSEYRVSWMGLPLAWSKSTTDTIEENGRKLIRLRMITKNYKAYSYIYKVDDATEVIIDPETALPLRLDFILNEGSIHKSHRTTFHHDKNVAIFHDRISNTVKDVPIDRGTQEIYSFLYSSRNLDIETLTARKHTLFVEGKLYELNMKIRKEGRIKLPGFGKVKSVQIEPLAEFDGIFLRQGKVFFWISKHNPRMITCIQAKVPVGKIKVKLQKTSGTDDDFWDQKK